MPAVGTAKGAREAGQLGLDAVGDLAAVAHPDARAGGSVRIARMRKNVGGLGPDRRLGVDADAVGAQPLGPPSIHQLPNPPEPHRRHTDRAVVTPTATLRSCTPGNRQAGAEVNAPLIKAVMVRTKFGSSEVIDNPLPMPPRQSPFREHSYIRHRGCFAGSFRESSRVLCCARAGDTLCIIAVKVDVEVGGNSVIEATHVAADNL